MGPQQLGNNCSQQIIEIQKNFARMQSAFWMDKTFRNQLSINPKKTMIENGLFVSANVDVQLYVNTDTASHFVIPEKPKNIGHIGLEGVAAAGTFGTGGTIACAGSFCGSLGTFGSVGTFGCSDL